MMQGEDLNIYGEHYIHGNRKLKMKVVDGSSLAVAVILNIIPKGTTQLLFRGKLSKVSYFTVLALCQKGIQVLIQEMKKMLLEFVMVLHVSLIPDQLVRPHMPNESLEKKNYVFSNFTCSILVLTYICDTFEINLRLLLSMRKSTRRLVKS